MKSAVANHLKLTMTNGEPSSNLILLQLLVAKELSVDHLTVSHLEFEVNWKGERAKQVGASGADLKKNHHFELSSSFLLCNKSEPCLDQIGMCNEKWTLSNNQS